MSSNASRLATRWLNRQSSQLDPPPAMVKAITEWVQEEYLIRVRALLPNSWAHDRTDYDVLKKFLANPSERAYSDVMEENFGYDLNFRWRQMRDPVK